MLVAMARANVVGGPWLFITGLNGVPTQTGDNSLGSQNSCLYAVHKLLNDHRLLPRHQAPEDRIGPES